MKNDASLQIHQADEAEERIFVVECECLVLCGVNIDMLGDMGCVNRCLF